MSDVDACGDEPTDITGVASSPQRYVYLASFG